MNRTTPLRGAVIGCGMIAEFHLRAWARIAEVEIVALADPKPAAIEQCCAQFAPEARPYKNLAEVLTQEKLDFVDILTPPALHRADCLLAKAAGLHVICQKPLCDELPDALALVAEFADSPRLFCVHENHVYRPWFQQVHALATAGNLGPLRLVRLEQHDVISPPQAFKRDAPRGVLLEYGVHLADMIRALLGVPQSVTAQLQQINPDIRGESYARVEFHYAEARAEIDIAWKKNGQARASALFRGDTGEAVLDGTMTRGGPARFRITAPGISREESRDPVADYAESFYLLQRDFVRAMRTGGPGPQPAAENVQTLAMIFAAYAAAEQKTSLNFSNFCAVTARALSH